MRFRTDNTKIFTSAALALILAVLPVFCGCSGLSSGITGGQSETDAPRRTSAAGTEAAAVTEYLPQNPVFAMFAEYIEDWRNAESGMLDAVTAEGSADASFAYSAFCEAQAELTLVYATVGMFVSDGAGFSGSFDGAYSGSGSMSSRGIFEYAFEDGSGIAGRIADDMLYCSVGVDLEPLIDPDEPTPEPAELTPEPGSESPEASSEPLQTVSEAPVSPAPSQADAGPDASAHASSGILAEAVEGAVFMLLSRTERGWIAAVLNRGRVALTEISDGRLYFAEGELSALPEGFDPLAGISAFGADGLGCPVLEYAEGKAVLLHPGQ